MLGLEVDSVTPLFENLESILTAKVTAVERHPDADKLTVCSVDTGTEVIQVVCGAPNVRTGMTTAIALPGVKLPDGTKIKKSKVRGVVSAGMLCSARELGLSDDHRGLIDLDARLHAGMPLIDALKRTGPNLSTEAVITELNKFKNWKGLGAPITWTPQVHQGTDSVQIQKCGPKGSYILLQDWTRNELATWKKQK